MVSWREDPNPRPVTTEEAIEGVHDLTSMGIDPRLAGMIIAMGTAASQVTKGGECENCSCSVCESFRGVLDGMDLAPVAPEDFRGMFDPRRD